MEQLPKRLIIALTLLVALLALAVAAPALAINGDYGVSAINLDPLPTSCGSAAIPCQLNWHGYTLTFKEVNSYGRLVYTFDDFDCTVYINPSSGSSSGRGSECDQYQP